MEKGWSVGLSVSSWWQQTAINRLLVNADGQTAAVLTEWLQCVYPLHLPDPDPTRTGLASMILYCTSSRASLLKQAEYVNVCLSSKFKDIRSLGQPNIQQQSCNEQIIKIVLPRCPVTGGFGFASNLSNARRLTPPLVHFLVKSTQFTPAIIDAKCEDKVSLTKLFGNQKRAFNAEYTRRVLTMENIYSYYGIRAHIQAQQ